jgi:hypothetical protein
MGNGNKATITSYSSPILHLSSKIANLKSQIVLGAYIKLKEIAYVNG